MQRVVMVNPNWEKGFIDKFLVCDLSLNNVEPIYRLDPEHLSHTQYAVSGNHLIRIRHCLTSNTLSEDVFLINQPHPHRCNNNSPICLDAVAGKCRLLLI